MLVATEYNKPLELGKYIVLIFNPSTKQIVYQKAIQGTAGGFGLRKYWASTAYNALRGY